ncbi:ABC transporter ATP-binding protein [Shouchella clausii]|uniref:ABC transporter ATP-binding protein n=1 Tax=Shouchella clausii TaxID=79880 RepID=UPI001C249762|nr:ABC transporter ATP-binding protein [Shouchella clausii]MBU8597132.1 ABC transporter ATP-binding protein [Shouchella clausii]MED4159431.1 ABC transporter ATP-binding protein [Shouchella clausii]MED4176150.1 ABC transporter ATP-binding protein [Shouchella clausii]
MIVANDLSVNRGGRLILDQVSFQAKRGRMLGILGANGSGKTTLLKTVTGFYPYQAGSIEIDGKPLVTLKPKERARRMAVLSQEEHVSFDVPVYEAVALGRYAHQQGLFAVKGKTDDDIIRKAMEETGISDMAERSLLSLSGGEKQRVWLARALAQQPDSLLLDEPTNHLDLARQVALMEHLTKLLASRQLTVVCILHDINLASLYCDDVLLLKNGKVVCQGETQSILTRGALENIYGTAFHEWQEPVKGRKQFSVVARV